MFISTDAIVLKNTPYKESSIISRLFTRESGKISTIFKGAKKNKNNIAGIIEPGNIINITFYNKSNLKIAKETKLMQTHYSSRKILTHYYYTMAIISLIDKLCMDHERYTALYDLSVDILEKMDEQKIDIEILFIYFLLHLNKQIGYELNIINSKESDNADITIFFNQLNNPIDILYDVDMDMIRKIDLINKLKVIIYRHMKHHVIDLNDVHAINMLKDIKNERNS